MVNHKGLKTNNRSNQNTKRGNLHEKVAVGFRFTSDWFRGGREPITKRTNPSEQIM